MPDKRRGEGLDGVEAAVLGCREELGDLEAQVDGSGDLGGGHGAGQHGQVDVDAVLDDFLVVARGDDELGTGGAGLLNLLDGQNGAGAHAHLGLGLGQSRQKYLYLPEEHNDYIFSIVCEELGYVGAVAILILFALLICRGYWIAAHSPDRYSFLVGVGITTLLSIQVFLNIAVVTNLIPCTGISLPFFSYGGTALLMQLGEMGIILSISRDIPTKKAR